MLFPYVFYCISDLYHDFKVSYAPVGEKNKLEPIKWIQSIKPLFIQHFLCNKNTAQSALKVPSPPPLIPINDKNMIGDRLVDCHCSSTQTGGAPELSLEYILL